MDKADLNEIKARVKPFIRNDGERLFFYDPKDNIWIPNTRDGAARSLNKLLAAADTQLAASEAKAVINDILCDPAFERPLPAPPCDMINCKNGILALNELKLYERPKNPPDKNYFRICLDIDYNPNVHERDCETFMKFLQNAFALQNITAKDLLKHPSVVRLLEMMGYMISNEYMAKKLLIILGPANSGKSQILELIRRVIGYEHTVALTLDELSGQGGGRFRTELLTKAHALINDELPTKGLKHLAELKKIIAGEAITIEAKGATPKTVKVKTKMLFAGNQLPDLAEADCGNAFASRLCVVAFKKAPEETDRDVNLIDDLYQERNAIFSLAIKAFIELRKRSPSLTFWEDKAADAIVKAYKDDNASVITFINDEEVVTTGDGVSLTELFSYYKDYCIKQALTPVKSIKSFRQQLVSCPQFSGFNKRRLRENKNPCSVVEGIKLMRGNL